MGQRHDSEEVPYAKFRRQRKKKKNHNLLFEAEDIYAHLKKGTATKLIRPSPSYLQDLPNILLQITARLKSVCNAGIRYEGKKKTRQDSLGIFFFAHNMPRLNFLFHICAETKSTCDPEVQKQWLRQLIVGSTSKIIESSMMPSGWS